MNSGHSAKSGPGKYSISDEALAALQCGDINALIKSHSRFAGMEMMADKDDDKDKDDSDRDDSGKDSDDSGDGDDDDDDDDDSGDDDDNDDKEGRAALVKRMQAADKRASKAEAALKEIQDAKKDDLTKATERADELEASNKEKDETISSLRLEVGFLSSNSHTWHKPGAALRMARSEGYLEDVLDEDGTLDEKAMGKALDRLAKEHSYLIKQQSGSSGESGGGRSGNGKDDKAERENDQRRAPALSRRR